jgi:putative membrane-bound dehydrogenase-like protein
MHGLGLLSSRYVAGTLLVAVTLTALSNPPIYAEGETGTGLRAGVAAQRIDPAQFPVWVSGGIVAGQGERIVDSLYARSLVLENEGKTIALCVVDSLGIPLSICQKAKEIVHQRTGIPPEQIMISATHTHSAPSVMGAHGTPVQEDYAEALPGWIAESIIAAHASRVPAQAGATVTNADRFIYCRHWIMEPGHAGGPLFQGRSGNIAAMNPGHDNPFKVRQTGEVDRTIPVLSVQDLEGRPLCVLASFCTHYAGAPAISSDYFGVVANELAAALRPESPDLFVGMMANATSGDANCIDYSRPARAFNYKEVGQYVAIRILEALPRVDYRRDVAIDSGFTFLTGTIRKPDPEEAREARAYVASRMGDSLPSNLEENYAREAVLLANGPDTRPLPLQALRIGDLAIATFPTETFNATGLAVRARSPFAITMNIELANDYAGYLPTASEFEVGGYTTWRARTSCLAVDTEEKIVATLRDLVAGLHPEHRSPSDRISETSGPYQHRGPDSVVPAPQSLELFEVEAGQTISLVASEPEVVDPVAMRFDDSGDLWVVEMRDYPDRNQDRWRGRIRVLRDEDLDGVFETSRTFADQLPHPTGVQWVRNGVLATVGGSLMRILDTDGDGIADKSEVVLTGFAEENTQLRVNDPEFGLDGQLYLANGLRSSRVTAIALAGGSSDPVDIANSDVRIDFRSGKVTRVSGPSQYGITWDRYGNRYGCNNRNPCDEVLVEVLDVERSALAGFAPMTASVVPAGEASRVRPLVDAWTTSNLHSGQFTAACGVLVSDSHHLPGASLGHALTCEPTGSLVHRVALGRVQGRSRVEEPDRGREWLASRDPWFRPVFLEEGPDGAIYIADMHRAVIEHPDWVPEELKHRPDERWGEDAGRIYRVARAGAERVDPIFRALRERPLGDRSDEELVALLSHANGWVRSMAARILDERDDPQCIALLDRYCTENRSMHPNGLLRAVYLLKRRGAWTSEKLEGLLSITPSDSRIHDPSLRGSLWETAVGLPGHWSAGLIELAQNAIRDAHRDEMLAATWSAASHFGSENPLPDKIFEACVERATDLADDRYVWMAVGSACRDRLLDFALRWGDRAEERIESLQLVKDACWDAWSRTIRLAAEPNQEKWRTARDRWFDRLVQRMTMPASNQEADRRLKDEPSIKHSLAMAQGMLESRDREWLLQKSEFWSWVSEQCTRSDRTLGAREACVTMLASAPDSSAESLSTLRSIIEQIDAPKFEADRSFLMSAFRAWAKRSDPQFAPWVVDHYRAAGPEMREAMWQGMRAKAERVAELVRALEQQRLPVSMFDAAQLQSLRASAAGDVQAAVDRLIDQRVDRDRHKVIDRYAASLSTTHDRARGKEIFGKFCAPCHRVDGVGESIGPEISDTRTQSALQILTAVLDPHRAVDPRYMQTIVRLEDGTVHEGLVLEESSRHIVLRNQQTPSLVIEKETIDTILSTGKSLMPEGIEAQIDAAAMNDLIGYLKNWRYTSDIVPATASTP